MMPGQNPEKQDCHAEIWTSGMYGKEINKSVNPFLHCETKLPNSIVSMIESKPFNNLAKEVDVHTVILSENLSC
ncbi:hypothetical protein DPMN_170446 [Dreissena polymorpha]|uniref:Uncharacterized protein n=1 Tax=Dreissena polymorpha TaxID=45954 RepID=A0A9D4DXV5_DREPO|nr:hypothetical protein DPMN_170446 [Dreissena polymorpha]